MAVQPPVVLELSEKLPSLPQFKSEDIRRQVFTHRSFHGRPNHIFEDHPNDPAPDNEKLEHLGDTVLSLVVTTLMNEMFPTLRVGPSTKARALIVNNATLANIAVRYNLPNDLRLHPAQAVALKASPNVQADLFESYVGGLYLDQGLEVVQGWLRELFRPYAMSAYRIVRAQHGLPAESSPSPPSSPSESSDDDQSYPTRSPFGPVNRDMTMTTIGHLALFNQHVQRSNQPVEWIYTSTNPDVELSAQGEIQLLRPEMMKAMRATTIWFVKVMVNGKCLGQGKGGTKKLARNEAAKLGLESLGVHVYPCAQWKGCQPGATVCGNLREASVAPDLYFKPPVGFQGPRFPPWSPYSTGTNSTDYEGNGTGYSNNSRHDFSRLRPGVTLCGALLMGLMRRAACFNAEGSWGEDGRIPHRFLNGHPSILQLRHFCGWWRRTSVNSLYLCR